METTQEKTVDTLNSLLRGELSAVETYEKALEKVDDLPSLDQLEACKRSHQQRVTLLRQQIRRLGGEPSANSGPWGGFARLVTGGARTFGSKAAIAALEEGEDYGLRQYRSHLRKLDANTRVTLEQSVLPEQERTHDTLSSIKRTLQ